MKKLKKENLSLEQEFLNSLKALSRLNKKAEESYEVQIRRWRDALTAIENAVQYIPKMDEVASTFSTAAQYLKAGYDEYEGDKGEMADAFRQAMEVGKNLPGIFSFGKVNIDVMQKYASAFSEIKNLPPHQQENLIKKLGLVKIAGKSLIEGMSEAEALAHIKSLPVMEQLPFIMKQLPFIAWAFNIYFGIYYFYYGMKDFFSILEYVNKTGLSSAEVLSTENLRSYFQSNKESPDKVRDIGVLTQTLRGFMTDVIGSFFNVLDFMMNSIFAFLEAASLGGWVLPLVGEVATGSLFSIDITQSLLFAAIEFFTDQYMGSELDTLVEEIKNYISEKINILDANRRLSSQPSADAPARTTRPEMERRSPPGGLAPPEEDLAPPEDDLAPPEDDLAPPEDDDEF